jgi:uncharacterized protein (DUF2236 family)
MLDLLPSPLPLPSPLQDALEAAARALLEAPDQSRFDFLRPAGEAALILPDSVSWRVYKNPLVLFVGGVTAVIMELAEPRVRSGVWEHTSFRADPMRRMRRTGLAAMVTIYGARSVAETMIEGVRRRHSEVAGTTPAGEAYRADDPELLDWVHATAAYGFLAAYHAHVQPLSLVERNHYYAEGATAARLYGGTGAPQSEAELQKMLRAMAPRLQRSAIVSEFLDIVRRAPVLPPALRPAQHLLVRAAVDLVPAWMRTILGLESEGLRPLEGVMVRQGGALADRIVLASSPAVQACQRMRLPADYLYAGRR